MRSGWQAVLTAPGALGKAGKQNTGGQALSGEACSEEQEVTRPPSPAPSLPSGTRARLWGPAVRLSLRELRARREDDPRRVLLNCVPDKGLMRNTCSCSSLGVQTLPTPGERLSLGLKPHEAPGHSDRLGGEVSGESPRAPSGTPGSP